MNTTFNTDKVIQWIGKGLTLDNGDFPPVSPSAQYAPNQPAASPENIESRLKNTVKEKIATAIQILNRGYNDDA